MKGGGPPVQRRGRGLPGRGPGLGSTTQLDGEFAVVRGRGGPGDEHALFDERLAWEQHLGARRLDVRRLAEGARRPGPAPAPSRSSSTRSTPGPAARAGSAIIGEGLLGPTLIALRHRRAAGSGSCPAIVARRPSSGARATREPNAGSDLANVADPGRARRRRVGHQRPEGVDVARPLGRTGASCSPAPTATPPEAPGHLVPARARWTSPASRSGRSCQITGTSSSTRSFFDGARTAADNVVGEVERRLEGRDGHARASSGARSTLGQQLALRARARRRSSTSARAQRRAPTTR